MILGLISDTHGLLRPEALAALQGSDAILHAGDVGRLEILEQLRNIAPVTAVRGNVDVDPLPDTATLDLRGIRIHIVHNLHDYREHDPNIRIVLSGHTHKPLQEVRGGVLFINPGSAGPRRFKLPITVAKLDLARLPWSVHFIDLATSTAKT